MKQLICLTAILCLYLTAFTSPIKPLTVGDRLPNSLLSLVLYNQQSNIKIADFKDKLIILDFMNTTCPSCIAALPRFDSLINQYRGRLQILVISSEKAAKVSAFLKHNKIAKKVSLPFITEDSLLKKYFPFQYIPHEVWLFNGNVVAITGPQYIISENIGAVLKGSPVNWPVKHEIVGFDYSKTLMVPSMETIPEGSMPDKFYSSAFTSHMDNITKRAGSTVDTATPTAREYMVNMSIIEMYLNALDLPPLFPTSHIIMDSSENSRFVFRPGKIFRDRWESQNTYCYEFIHPLKSSQQAVRNKILADLDFYFGLHAKFATKKVDCWVLARSPNDTVHYHHFGNGGLATVAGYANTASITYRLNNANYGQPVFDESGLLETDFFPDKKIGFTNIGALNSWLKENGLLLRREQRETEMLVITADIP